MALTVGTSAVWFVFGLWFKVLGMVPRHELIVAAVAGERAARFLTVLIGLGEIAIALWILSGIRPIVCAALQSVAIATMNGLELILARNLLLAPAVMICANTALLVAVWYCALKVPPTESLT